MTIDIHDPKLHTKVISGIAAVVVGAVGYGAVSLHNLPPPQVIVSGATFSGYEASPSVSTITPSMFGHHDYTIFVSPGSGGFPDVLVSLIKTEGNKVQVIDDSNAHEGIWMSPDVPEVRALASVFEQIIGESVIVGNDVAGEQVYGSRFEIGIGHPVRRGSAK